MAASLLRGRAGVVQLRQLWWLYPANVVGWLSFFGVYSLWTIVFFHSDQFHQYLSPFYSPQVAIGRTAVSPALFIFYIPLGFRATCYYYRKAYYRSFFADPPACAKGEPSQLAALAPTGRGAKYRGEAKLPFVLNNLHRFFMYLAVGFVVVLLDRRDSRLQLPRPPGLRSGQRPDAGQHRAAHRIHVRLPFPAPPGGRRDRLFLLRAGRGPAPAASGRAAAGSMPDTRLSPGSASSA